MASKNSPLSPDIFEEEEGEETTTATYFFYQGRWLWVLDTDHCRCCCVCINCRLKWGPDAIGCTVDQSSHRDFRSEQKAINRQKKQSQKYYGYRGVKPSWTGQQYYAVVITPNDDTKSTDQTNIRHKARSDSPRRRPKPSSALSTNLVGTAPIELHNAIPNRTWLSFYSDSYVFLGLTEARANNSLDDIPNTLALLKRDLDDLRSYPANIHLPHLPPNGTIKLTTLPWTKRDNFNMKDIGICPLDRRHHRGKKYREKCHQKEFGAMKRRREHRIHHDDHAEHRWVEDETAGTCCERCEMDLDVDNHMTAEVQTHEEYKEARDLVIQALKPIRLAEGDSVWEIFYGPHRNRGMPQVEEEREQEQEQEQAVEQGREDEDDDTWSGIIITSAAFWAGRSNPSMSEYDIVSEQNFPLEDAGWDLLSSVGSTADDESPT